MDDPSGVGENATLALIRRCRFTAAQPGDAARAHAALCLLDWLGVTLAGAREPEVDALVADLMEDGGGTAPLIGRSERLGLRDTVLVNGFASHLLDYDDGLPAMTGHSSVAILPALLALAVQRERSLRDLLDALVGAVEMAGCLGRMMAPDHYRQGFHATGTVGAIGAAVGCAMLLDLDEATSVHAIGLAGARAAGLKASFGSSGKPLHAGWAALVGLTSARWAARGLTGSGDVIGHPQGFHAAEHGGSSLEVALAPAPGGAHILGVFFKRYAACGVTHPTIDALIAIEARLRPEEEIESLSIRIGRDADRICNIADPRTGLEAKFSLRMVSAMLLDGRDVTDPNTFTDEATADPALAAWRARVTVSLEDDWPPVRCALSLRTRDGRLLEEARQSADHASAPAPQVHAKFQALASRVLGTDEAARVVDFLRDPDDHRGLADLAEGLRR